MINAPVLHVNGDHPEGDYPCLRYDCRTYFSLDVVRAVETAFSYRNHFRKVSFHSATGHFPFSRLAA